MSDNLGYSEDFVCELITPDEKVFSGNVNLAQIPGIEGEFGVLAKHSPLITAIDSGVVELKHSNKSQKYFISGGFIEVNPEKCLILADFAKNISSTTIDAEEKHLKSLENQKNQAFREEEISDLERKIKIQNQIISNLKS